MLCYISIFCFIIRDDKPHKGRGYLKYYYYYYYYYYYWGGAIFLFLVSPADVVVQSNLHVRPPFISDDLPKKKHQNFPIQGPIVEPLVNGHPL